MHQSHKLENTRNVERYIPCIQRTMQRSCMLCSPISAFRKMAFCKYGFSTAYYVSAFTLNSSSLVPLRKPGNLNQQRIRCTEKALATNPHLGSFHTISPSSRCLKNGLLHELDYCIRFHYRPSGKKMGTCIKVTASSSQQTLESFRKKSTQDINVLVVGSTGYIGKFVVKELMKRGYNVIAVARERSGINGRQGKNEIMEELKGAQVCFADVTDISSLKTAIHDVGVSIDVIISCLASRSGGVKDSWRIDYEATKNSLVAGKAAGASHFVLLSAICVQKPLLEFQRAKLKFEAELQREAERGELTYSIVRPTAFFKSLGGQVELAKSGKPYVMFGDGRLCACKPISERDLASFMVDCILEEDKINKILPIGGPGKALTPLEQGEMIFRLMGKEPKFLKVPLGIMDFAIGVLDFLVKVFPSLEDAAEFGKIGRYYAAESMLLLDPKTGEYDANATPSYGRDTLEEFFERVLREGMAGQELGDQAVF